MKKEHGEIKIVFTEEGDQFIINDLVDFLKQWKGIYAYALGHPDYFQEILPDKLESIEKNLLPVNWVEFYSTTGLSEAQISRSYKKKLKDDDIQIVKISKQSPLELVVGCVIVFGVLALVFGGGKVKWSEKEGVEVELKSLGEGVQHMTKALNEISERRERRETRHARIEAVQESMALQTRHEKRRLFIEELKDLNDVLNVPNINPVLKERLEKSIVRITKKIDELGL